jgi:hypothetical protein
MRENSIVVACDAGIPVVLAATRRAAQQLERLAEDLLVAGAELEILSGIERAPARLAETLDRLDRPAVLALCFTAEDVELDALRAMLAEHGGAGHMRIECEIGCGRGSAGLHPVIAAMRELERRNSDAARTPVVEIVQLRGEHVSDAILVPPLLPVVAASEALARPRRRGSRAWAWALGAAASASAALSIAVLAPAAAAPTKTVEGGDAFAAVAPKPAPAAGPEARTSALPRSSAPLPSVHVAAQGPAPSPIIEPEPSVAAPPGDATPGESELDVAIRQRKAIVDEGLVAHLVAGDRDWYAAMNTCRARGFWRTGGWRVPTVAELRSLARTRAFADAVVWSTRRDAEDPQSAVTVTMRAGTTTTTDKRSTEISTICVKDRG